ERVSLHLDIHILGLDAGKHYMTKEFLAVFVDAGFDGRNKPFGQSLLFMAGAPVEKTVEDLVEDSAEVDHFAEKGIAGNQRSHRSLLSGIQFRQVELAGAGS